MFCTWTMSLSAYRPWDEILSSSPSSSIISMKGSTSVRRLKWLNLQWTNKLHEFWASIGWCHLHATGLHFLGDKRGLIKKNLHGWAWCRGAGSYKNRVLGGKMIERVLAKPAMSTAGTPRCHAQRLQKRHNCWISLTSRARHSSGVSLLSQRASL